MHSGIGKNNITALEKSNFRKFISKRQNQLLGNMSLNAVDVYDHIAFISIRVICLTNGSGTHLYFQYEAPKLKQLF